MKKIEKGFGFILCFVLIFFIAFTRKGKKKAPAFMRGDEFLFN